jgi:hypothetical protein
VVKLPRRVSLETLQKWGSEFIQELQIQHSDVGLLFNTNTHDFESIDCLKWLRKFFSEEHVVKNSISRVAFVQPIQYRRPEVVNRSVAYFATVHDAYHWLSLN